MKGDCKPTSYRESGRLQTEGETSDSRLAGLVDKGAMGAAPRGWNMTTSELRTYRNRADINSAMAELSTKARNHA